MKNGVIADFQITEKKMLQAFIHKVHEHSFIGLSPSPQVLVCLPCQSTGGEESDQGVCSRRGRPRGLPIEEPMAAADGGAGLPGGRGQRIDGGGHRWWYHRDRADFL